MGEGITTMLCKTNPEVYSLFTFRLKVLIMSSIKDRQLEGLKEHDTDIWGNTIQNLKVNLTTKGGSRHVVKDVTHILEGQHPATCRSTWPVHDGISPGLDGSVPPLSRV